MAVWVYRRSGRPWLHRLAGMGARCRRGAIAFAELLVRQQPPAPPTVGNVRVRAVRQADINVALPYLERLLALLPQLRAIVLIGRKAQRAQAAIENLRPQLPIFFSPHPSPLFVNAAPGNRQRILAVLQEVARGLSSQ